MNARELRAAVSCVALATGVFASSASAQDAGSLADDASSQAAEASDASANGLVISPQSADAASGAPARADEGACEEDPVPSGHEVRIETRVSPARPKVGDRVLITYRLIARSSDRVEFEPDPAAFAQPGNEVEYARAQPDRDRQAHAGPNGTVYGEVSVAVQPFKTGEVVFARQLARLNAAGDVVRVCTPAVRFRVGDPFGNTAHPTPRDLTQPEEVTTDSLRWRYVMFGVDAAFALIVATVALNSWVRSRPKPEAPPPPPIPPWISATEALEVLSRSDLLSRGLTKDYYDQLSDIVRRYIGALRNFDALEMTTVEVLAKLKRVPIAGVTTAEVAHLLTECDLVKFARHVPSHEESEQILDVAFTIVKRSSPAGLKSAASEAKSDEGKSDGRDKPAKSEGAEKPESTVVEHEEKRG
ncbi:MAG: hypothetical protein U0269_18340 [Polyangiales bacterium]